MDESHWNGGPSALKSSDSPALSVSSTSMSTSTHLPLCVYCGTARPADQTRCPHCGRPWIDVRIGGTAEAANRSRVPAIVGTAAATGATVSSVTSTDDAPVASLEVGYHRAGDGDAGAAPSQRDTATDATDVPPPFVTDEDQETDASQRFVWLIPALIAAAAVIVVGLFGSGLLDRSEPVAAPIPATTPVPTTAAPATTTQAPTTTTAAPTTTVTTTTLPAPAAIAPVGDAIPMSSLTLRAAGIGPVLIGDAAPEAMGRLVASLGRPEELGAAGEELGLCAGEEGRFVRWAGLTTVVSGTLEDGTFAGYRYMEQAAPTMHLDFSTPSGLRVGDPVSSLNEIYSKFQVDYVSDGGESLFRLSDADGLLLWGPVSSIEATGRVEGIHSPDPCTS